MWVVESFFSFLLQVTSGVIPPALSSSVIDLVQDCEPITGSPLPDPKKKKYELVKPQGCATNPLGFGSTGKRKCDVPNLFCVRDQGKWRNSGVKNNLRSTQATPSLFPLLEYHLSKSAYIRSIFVVTMLANKLRQKMRHFTQMPPPNLLLTKKIELSTYCSFKPSSFWTILSSTNIIWPYICVSEYPSLTLDLQGRLNSVPSSNQSRKLTTISG